MWGWNFRRKQPARRRPLIGGLWMQRFLIRRPEYAAADANSVEHLGVMRTVRLQQMRLARFIGSGDCTRTRFPHSVVGNRQPGAWKESDERWPVAHDVAPDSGDGRVDCLGTSAVAARVA